MAIVMNLSILNYDIIDISFKQFAK